MDKTDLSNTIGLVITIGIVGAVIYSAFNMINTDLKRYNECVKLCAPNAVDQSMKRYCTCDLKKTEFERNTK